MFAFEKNTQRAFFVDVRRAYTAPPRNPISVSGHLTGSGEGAPHCDWVGRHVHHHKVEHPDVWQKCKQNTVSNNDYGYGCVVALMAHGGWLIAGDTYCTAGASAEMAIA
jgi:hypothetical protein